MAGKAKEVKEVWELDAMLGLQRKSAFDEALSMTGQLSGKPNIYRLNSMLKDPGVSYPLHMLKLPLSRSRLVYRNPDKDIKRFVQEQLKELKQTIQFDALTALDHGFSAFERRFVKRNGMYHYKEFIHLNPEYIWIRIHPKTKRFDGIEQRYMTEEIKLPAEKSYVFAHKKEFSNLYGKAQIEFAYVPWLLDREFYRFHGVALQEFGIQTLLGKAPAGRIKMKVGDDEVEVTNAEFLRLLAESIHSRSVVVLPAGEMWELGTLFDKKSGATWDFNKDHEFLDTKKALAILVPSEVWKEGGGSYAKSRIQSFWFEQTIGALLEELTFSVMRHIIKPIIRVNFWDGKEEPPYGELHGESPSLNYHDMVKGLVMKHAKADQLDWESIFGLMRIPGADVKEEKFGLGNIPTDHKTLREFCIKSFKQGIEAGKKELAYTGYVPILPGHNESMKAEGRRLRWIFDNTSAPEMSAGVILARLCAEGREYAHNFFHKTIKEGNYNVLGKGGKNVA